MSHNLLTDRSNRKLHCLLLNQVLPINQEKRINPHFPKPPQPHIDIALNIKKNTNTNKIFTCFF